MQHAKKNTLVVVLLMTLLACANTPPNPYRVEQSQVQDRIKTIGLMPAYLQLDTGRDERITRMLEQQVTVNLEQAGYKVIPSSNFTTIYDRLKPAAGPLFDATTGEPLQEKVAALREQTRKFYQTQNNVDASVTIGIYIVQASWTYHLAEWDGVKEPITGKDGFMGFLITPHDTGSVNALSFGLSLHALDDTLMYERFGGVQLMSHVKGKDFLSVPMNRLLVDQAKITNAIDYAMGPLIGSDQ